MFKSEYLQKRQNLTFFIKFNLSLFNLIIIIINLFLILKNKATKDKEKIRDKDIKINLKFKNAEEFLYLISKKYKQISNYLNEKYNHKIINNMAKSNKRYKKRISLYSVDLFNPKGHRFWLKNKLKDKFRIKFDKHKPDYLIYNVFGNEHLNEKYSNSIKIAFFTENLIPDLNKADYAIGQAHINYFDRYFKFPIFLWRNIKIIEKLREKSLQSPIRKKFCAAVISNNILTDGFRTKFIDELNKYKQVDMGGRFLNNVGGPVVNKIEFLSSYKFSIAMENSDGDGYVSEKIYDSLISGTIPIYYGDFTVDEYINPKAFILIKDEKHINEKIKYIIEIDNNIEKYLNILKEKILINENIDKIIEKEVKQFLYNIFEQEKSKAKRIYD
jgi:hypothetical protein